MENSFTPFPVAPGCLEHEHHTASPLAAGRRGSQQPSFFVHNDTGRRIAAVKTAAREVEQNRFGPGAAGAPGELV